MRTVRIGLAQMNTTPRDVVQSALRAFDAQDWDAFLALVHPDSMERFKAQEVEQREHRALVSSQVNHLAAGAMALVAQFLAKDTALADVFAVDSVAALKALPATLVLRRWLRVSTGRRAPDGEGAREVLGEVFEGPDIAHVVFRERREPVATEVEPTGSASRDRTRLITACRTPQGWRITLGGGLVFDEAGGSSLGYTPGEVEPTAGEEHRSDAPIE